MLKVSFHYKVFYFQSVFGKVGSANPVLLMVFIWDFERAVTFCGFWCSSWQNPSGTCQTAPPESKWVISWLPSCPGKLLWLWHKAQLMIITQHHYLGLLSHYYSTLLFFITSLVPRVLCISNVLLVYSHLFIFFFFCPVVSDSQRLNRQIYVWIIGVMERM